MPGTRGRTLKQRFYDFVNKTDTCWMWTGATAAGRYGKITVNKRCIAVHRLAWIWANDQDIPAGMYVCHSCDNVRCVNPAHLFLGTPKDNHDDMARKGRRAYPGRKLTPEQVARIPSLRAAGLTFNQIGAMFGVNGPTINHITQGRNWRHAL